MKIENLTVGSDPEMLVRDRQTKQIVSAIPLVPEGKEVPRDLGDGFKVLHDNVLLEFNIPPCMSQKDFVDNLREGFKRISAVIGNKYELVAQASHTYEAKFCKHFDATLFGCQPEYCAWERRICKPPSCTNTFRSAGAHIHIGRTDFKEADTDFLMRAPSKMEVIKMMDIHVGLVLTLIDQDPTSHARKQLYGKAGRHRPTPYGVEWRTASNFWLRSPELARLIYDLTEFTVHKTIEGGFEQIIEALGAENVQAAINNNQRDLARQLLNKVEFPDTFQARIAEFEKPREFDFCKEWGL